MPIPHRVTSPTQDQRRAPDATAPGASAGVAVAFLFPGVGDQYPQMARGLYEAEPVFRAEVDRCAKVLRAHLGADVREALYPGDAPADAAAGAATIDLRRMLGLGGAADAALARTEIAHPAVFVVEYALARLWMERGIVPGCMLGHSLGEYVAATVAGVFALEDALALVAARARMIDALPAGAMLAVPLDPDALRPHLVDGVALAAVNAPGLCTVSGRPEAVAALEADLAARGHTTRRLQASHAFHSAAMEPVAARLAERVRGMALRAPSIPFLSNVTGTWITAEQATDPAYWASHLTRTVRFSDALHEALRTPGRVFLEVGPGRTLGTFALHAGAPEAAVLASLRHAYTRRPDAEFFAETLGRLRTTDVLRHAAHVAPATETERAVASLWRELLDVAEIGARDDFFALGGHSMLAMQVLARLRESFRVRLSLRDFFASPTVADLAAQVDAARASESPAPAPIPAAPRDRPLPLSFSQERLWFLEKLGAAGAYNVPRRLRLRGRLDRHALTRALDRIVARHEALRTTFIAVDGEPRQRIAPAEESAFRLIEHDLLPLSARNERGGGRGEGPQAELARLTAEEADAPFDLERGPLVRGRLVRLADDDHVLLVTIHHIVSDGWSLDVLAAELGALYAAFVAGEGDPLPPLPLQYADYAAWHRRWAADEAVAEQGAYWEGVLRDAPGVLELPLDRPRPARQDLSGASVPVALDAELTAALMALGRRHGTTPFMTLMAAWSLVLGRLAGQEDVVVGIPAANRGRGEVEGLIGFFVNSLALRVDLSGSPTVAELLARVKARALEAQRHADIPFEQVVERVQPVRSLAHTPVFQVMLTWEGTPPVLDLPGLAPAHLERSPQGTAKVDLALFLSETDGRIGGELYYATSLFDRATVERWLGYLRRVLEAMAGDAARPVDRLEMLSDAERRQLVDGWNAGAEDPADACVHETFERQVERTPGAVAVTVDDDAITYAELNARANRLAHQLIAMGVGPDVRVGLCVEPGAEMMAAVLAVLKAGGGYVPLDPAYPEDRLAYMLADSAPAVLLTQSSLRNRFDGAAIPILSLDADAGLWAHHPETPPAIPYSLFPVPSRLAYVIYTSGSTGRPKGVRVEHGALAATMAAAGRAFGFGADDRAPSLASFAFDIWLFESLLPLLHGGSVRMFSRERVLEVPRLVEDLRSCTVLHAVPALMRGIVREVRATGDGVLPGLRRAFVGGDAVAPDLLEEMRIAFPAAEIHVLYGPTEATIICAAHRLGAEPATRQMVGRPLGNAALYVLEPGGTIAPVGVPGELCLGGRSVARDYLGRPALTAERFVPDPFAAEPGARLYRTGDRVRWVEVRADSANVRKREDDGSREDASTLALSHSRTFALEFLGRTDRQVKVRGFRIEPGEIEARLREHAGVAEAVVDVRPDAAGERRLVAYLVPARDDADERVELWPSIGEHFVYDELIYQGLTSDERRHASYRVALERLVRGKVVVDVGTGAHAVLARMCIEAGAARVYAIEILERSYLSARRAIADAGMDDRITLIHGDALTVQLPEPADVCVSEIVEAIAGAEGAAPILNGARRFLKEGGRFIPERNLTRIAAVSLPDALYERPAFTPVAVHYVERIFAEVGHPFNVRLCIKNFPQDHLLSEPGVFEDQDFRGPVPNEYDRPLTLRFTRDGRFDGFLLWLRLHTVEDEVMDILEDRTAWFPTFFPVFHPGVDVRAGDRIEAVCSARLSENGVNPDYEIRGRLVRPGGESVPFAHRSAHHEPRFGEGPLFDRLFGAGGIAVEETAPRARLADEVRGHLRERLPEHMVPAAFVELDALPLNPNGKVDRKALPAPEGAAADAYEAPVGETETALARLWAEVLGVERVGRRDHFFALGGHSLLAVQVISRIRQALGVEVTTGQVFERPVLADFARGVESAARAELPPIEPADRAGPLALSFAQQRLWFLERLGEVGAAYHLRRRIRLRGALDRDALRRALDRIVARHEALRTTFGMVDGEPVQRIAPASHFPLIEHDLSGDLPLSAGNERGGGRGEGPQPQLERLIAEEGDAPFDLEHGPLARGRLVRLAEDDHLLLVTMHHIVSDGWSTGVLLDELRALYAAFVRGAGDPLPPLPVQYADYAAWQRRWMDGEVLEAQAAYWERALAGAPELLELPTERPRPARQDHAGDSVDLVLDAELTAALRELGRRHGTTLYMTILAGWAAVLGRLSGQRDVVVGTPAANRGRREIEGLIGFFVNTLALRVDLDGAPTVAGLLGRVKARVVDAQQHQDVPFEQVVERVQPARSLAHTPLFQVMFAWQNAARQLALPGLEPAPVEGGSRGTAKFDLTLELREADGRIEGGLEYATALFDRATAERYAGYLHRVLRAIAADADRPVDALDLLSDAERRQVLEGWNATDADFPRHLCIHQLFEAQAERTPAAIAVTFDGESLPYAELNARANRLAHHLVALGVGPDVRVGLCLERSVEMVVALLATLKAGGAYVPLDPDAPRDRLRAMLADAAPAVLLTQAAFVGHFDHNSIPVLAVDADAAQWADRPTSPVPYSLFPIPSNLAYVIYTSGSTGTPKGVMNAHRGVVNRLDWMERAYRLQPGEAVLQKTPYTFDVSVWEFFWPLMTGARLVMARPGGHRDPGYLIDTIRGEGITTLHFVPSMLRAFLDAEGVEACTSLRRVVCSGEALPAALVRRFHERLPSTELHNLYGPTEAAVDVTAWQCGADTGGVVPIGRPMANVRIYVLDARMQPVPAGVAGELYIGGIQVARGYLRRAALTAERFVPDPFAAEPGARLYRTGDLARWLADGSIEYLGRNDFQVKVRGFRIEPGEIEARLAEHPSVREAVVLARADASGDTRLVAYVVGEAVEVDALRAHLAARLPEYMVPGAFVRLDALPLTSSGKLDRKALPAPDGDAFARRGYEAPAGETEQALAEIWAEVLGVERVGRHDNFFHLGGHSLLVVKVVERMRQRGLHAGMSALFATPTPAALAAAVGGESPAVAVPANRIPAGCERITPAMLPLVELSQAEIDTVVAAVPGGAPNVQDIYPLAPLQEGFLFHHLVTAEGDPFLMAGRVAFDGREALDAHLAALQRVIDRHDVLRTAVAWDGLREPVQVVWRDARLPVDEVELDAAAGDAAKQLYELVGPRRHRMDVRRAPLMRACIARDPGTERWVLLLLIHHLVSDHATWAVLRDEVRAHLEGRADQLPAPLPFRDYVAQARLRAAGDEHEAYFRALLSDVDEPTAPFGLLDARGDGSGIGEARLAVDAALAARLRERARALGVSAASVCHVAWAQVLARVSGRDDVVFGTVLFGRMLAGEGAGRVLGPFINTLPVRLRVGGEGAGASVRAAHRQLAELLRHEHASLALAQRCSAVEPPAPLFTALLNYRHGSAAAEPGYGEERTNYPLALSVDDRGEALGLVAQAPASVGAERVCALMHRALEGLVDALETAPGRPLAAIDVLPEAERARVVDAWNATDADFPRHLCIHHLFEAQAERTPAAIAVTFDGESLPYAELNARANRLAHHLVALGVGPDVRVGLCLERSVEMVVALLATLKAGGAYVPLDPDAPRDRLRAMLADAAPAVLLTQAVFVGHFDHNSIPVLALDADAAQWADRPTSPVPYSLFPIPSNLAYVIYTSGSTGTPKGVMNAHRGVVNRLDWMERAYRLQPGEAVLQKTPYTFDVSVWEFFWPLMTGARLVMARPGGHRDPAYLIDTIRGEGITTLHFVPSMLRAFLDAEGVEACTSLRRVVCSGEALPAALVRRFHERLPSTELHNLYGPTEAAVDVTAWQCGADAGDVVPIGRPMANVRIYLLDARMQPVPVGVAGELFIGGIQVARGYLRRAALTAERFVPDPFAAESGARLYRTGDLARWLADGSIEYLGRNDFQVKVRGFRIEPGEIEARLAEHPSVREAVVLARADASGDTRLVAYVVGEAVEVDALRAHLAARLPEYMVPGAFVRLDALPLTSSGKLDRKALPTPDDDGARAYEAPVGETEQALAEIWAQVLGVERVGRRDHFFALGGHSLLAVQAISRIRRVLGAEAGLDEVFQRPVLADFARGVADAARADLPPIEPAERGGRLALSFAQRRLWFLEQLGGIGSAYHVWQRLRLRGPLDRDALGRALDRIVARHEALRTTFVVVDGEPEQRIAPAAGSRFHLVEHDLSALPLSARNEQGGGRGEGPQGELERIVDEEAHAPFDLARGPLARGRLVRIAHDDHVLLLTIHHAVADGWSVGVLARELGALYAAFARGADDPLPPLPIQYADYAAWQRRWVEGQVLESQAAYWQHALAGAPELLELPTDRPRPARQELAGASVPVELDADLTAQLRALGRAQGTTLFMTLLAGWAAVLARLSGQDDVVIGTPAANRGRGEVEGLIGFFVNTLALRVEMADAPTVAELLGRVRARALEAQRHQDIPFEQVVERVQPARSTSHAPLFQVMFAWQNTPDAALRLPGIDVSPVPASARRTAKFDLTLALGEEDGRIEGRLEYATALFDQPTAERFAEYLRHALAAMAADAEARIDRLPILPEAERRQVLEGWNATDAEYPAESCIHELFQAQAARTPGAAALVHEGRTIPYAELNARANRLAQHLRGMGVGPDARVAVCVERSPEMVVALLAVLKAGGAYVPLDPEYPEERLRYVLADSAPAVLLTRASLRARLGGVEVPAVELDDPRAWAEQPSSDPARNGVTPEHLAYVIYTSGSTGAPKGVMIRHRAAANLLAWGARIWELGPDDAVLQTLSFSFDASVREIFPPLLSGARLVLARPGAGRDPEHLVEAVRRDGVTTLGLPPTMLQAFLEQPGVEGCHTIRRMISGGEALPPGLVQAFHARLPRARLFHEYGPTEATVTATVRACAPDDGAPPASIGHPIDNARVYVLSAAGEPVPAGAAGELYVGGAGVARGYLDRPALTAERFVPDPFGAQPGARLYRTGDLARWTKVRECESAKARKWDDSHGKDDSRADAVTLALSHSRTFALEFLGRTDSQVKLRGFRIEPGEIEARLCEHGSVREAAVVVREDTPGDRRLVAYVTGGAVEAEALRAHLADRVPEYMVPAAYVRLDALPLTPSGKVDRRALPAPEGDAFARRGYEAPEGETEQALAEIWAQLLGVERVGRHDHFFRLGGHSLLATRLAARIKAEMDVDLALGEVFDRPELSRLAQRVLDAQLAQFDPARIAELAELVRAAGG